MTLAARLRLQGLGREEETWAARVVEFLFPAEVRSGGVWWWAVVAVVGLKVLVGPWLASGDTLAIYRFVTGWLEAGLRNPWDHLARVDPVLAHNEPPPFPYPPGMLVILGVGRAPTYLLGLTSGVYSPWAGFPLKWMMVGFDLVCGGVVYRLCREMLPAKQGGARAAYLLWALSPVSLYVTYLQGQFDIVPVTLTAVFLLCLLRRQYALAWGTWVLACGVKHYAVPLGAVGLLAMLSDGRTCWSRRAAWTAAGVAAGLAVVGPLYAAFWHSAEFQSKVIHYHEGERVWIPTWQYINGILWVYLVPAYVAVCIGMLVADEDAVASRCARLAMLLLMGFSTVIIPMPGWYLWSLPFACVVLSRVRRGWVLMALTGGAYLAYFCYFKWTVLWQLAMWWKRGWPLHVSPEDVVLAKSGPEAAARLGNLLFSLLTGLQVAMIIRTLFFRAGPTMAREAGAEAWEPAEASEAPTEARGDRSPRGSASTPTSVGA